MDSVWLSSIYTRYGQVPYWTRKGEKHRQTWSLTLSNKLVGAEVRMPKGDTVAQVRDLVIVSSEGRIAFMVLSNVRGRGDNFGCRSL